VNGPASPQNAPVSDVVRVLVIDDEEGMREGMRRVLDRRGFSVRTAGDGETALAMLQETACDIALVDLKMPGMDGFKVTERIAAQFGSRTVVVIVSALATVDAAVEVTRHGAFDFLVKPFTPGDLTMVVERAVRQRTLIQEREKYLSELSNERTLSRRMINSMGEGVVVFNIRREAVLMNPRAEEFLGCRYREGVTLAELFPEPELEEVVAREIAADSQAEPSVEPASEARPEPASVQKWRGERMLNVGVTPLQSEGAPAGAIVILTDVTDAWKAEQDKNRFVSMVAHELKSPLSAILNYINVILTGMFDDNPVKVKEMLERCKVRGESLLELIRDLLFINSKEAGKVPRTMEDLDLKEALSAQLEFFRVAADRKGLTVSITAPLARYPVRADRGDLDRIFMNLISNGMKYNRDKGRLTISIIDGGSAWDISITDTGIGMSEAEMAGLFQEFYRVKSRKTSGITGTGLGLATVKRVLGEYDGRISVRSVPDEGSTFTVSFPKDFTPQEQTA
jgi:two-component system, OmpR family, phosphate regulon sensor histidine kinase PhoR